MEEVRTLVEAVDFEVVAIFGEEEVNFVTHLPQHVSTLTHIL